MINRVKWVKPREQSPLPWGCIASDSTALVERVSYDADGMARHHHAADINSDGAVTQEDYDIVTQNLGNFGVGDITRSGTVVKWVEQRKLRWPRTRVDSALSRNRHLLGAMARWIT